MPARRLPPATKKPNADASPEERARQAIAREEEVPGDKVRMTFRVALARRDAEALSARAIREQRNIDGLVQEILSVATRGRSK